MERKKELGILISAFFIVFSCTGQSYDYFTLKELNLKGPVKSFTIKKSENGGNITEIYSFNERGDLIEMNNEYTNITYNGKPSHNKEIYNYDDNGKLISKELYGSAGGLIETCKYKYDNAGNRIEALTVEQPEGKLYNKYSNVFDENGNMIAFYFVHLKYGNRSKWIFKYDDKGVKTESKDFNDDSTYLDKYTHAYNDNGDIAVEKSYDSKGKLKNVFTYTYEYDNFGNWIKETLSIPDEHDQVRDRIIEYDSKNTSPANVVADKIKNENKVDSSRVKYLSMLHEAYERSQFEVRVSDIVIAVSKYSTDTVKAYKKISAIRERILKGEEFEKLAIKYSEDPAVSNHKDNLGRVINGNNGDLGYFTVFKKEYPFETTAYNTKVGELSPIFRTSGGYHIIKVTDKRKAGNEGTFQEMKASLLEKLLIDPRGELLTK